MMEFAAGAKSIALWWAAKSCSRPSNRLKVQVIAPGWFVATQLVLLSSATGQDPAIIGQFSPVTTWPNVAVHANLLPTGKVLWWPPFEYGDNPTIWDPSTNTNAAITRVGANIFCSGHAFLSDGRLL